MHHLKTTFNTIQTRGVKICKVFTTVDMDSLDLYSEDTRQFYEATTKYFFVTQQPDGTDQMETELTNNFFRENQGTIKVSWVNNRYWVAMGSAESALFYKTEPVVFFATTIEGHYIVPNVELAVDPITASFETKDNVRTFEIGYHPTSSEHIGDFFDVVRYEIPIPVDENHQSAASTDPMPPNIKDFLTPKSRPYFEYVNKLLCRMLKAGQIPSAAVFGGYVLNLVEHAFAYKANPVTATYTPPKDLDVWLKYDLHPTQATYTANSIRKLFNKYITPYLKEAGYTSSWDTLRTHHLNYGVHNLRVDDEYQFDFVANMNGRCQFDDLGDFSVNNLYYDVFTGRLGVRIATEYTLDEILDHIKAKRLVPLMHYEKLKKHIRTKSDYDWYYDKMCMRERKTQAKGYAYKTCNECGSVAHTLPAQFATAMKPHVDSFNTCQDACCRSD